MQNLRIKIKTPYRTIFNKDSLTCVSLKEQALALKLSVNMIKLRELDQEVVWRHVGIFQTQF